jgi:hypothetical protein
MSYNAPPPASEPTAVTAAPVLDLHPTVAATRIVLERDLGPLDQLSPDARRRLLIRVLCGLVAYDDPEASTHSLAG